MGGVCAHYMYAVPVSIYIDNTTQTSVIFLLDFSNGVLQYVINPIDHEYYETVGHSETK